MPSSSVCTKSNYIFSSSQLIAGIQKHHVSSPKHIPLKSSQSGSSQVCP
uniref:Uncharacterized protein n=1 Tax=Arundo donax TaxID=35708 RepID=A0A0A9KYM6_ARUDO